MSSGLQQLGWLIGRNDSTWISSKTSKLPPGISTPKEDILTSLVNKKLENTTPMTTDNTDINNSSEVLGMIGKIQGIVASAKKIHQTTK